MPTRATAPAESEFPIDPQDLVVGLGRGLRVIEAFDENHSRMTIAQVASATGLARSATRRHLLSLCHFGYAHTDGKQFWLAPRVMRLGQSYLESSRLPRLVQPFIQRLSMQVGETVNVSILDGHEVVYVARSNSPRFVSIGFHAGDRVPAHTVTAGVVILATHETPSRDHWIDEHEFSSFTPTTPVDRAGFLTSVEAAKKLGFWITDQQLDVGLGGVAVGLKDRHGKCLGAIGITFQVATWARERVIERLVPALVETAQTLRQIL